jgi:glucose-6-phosphate 1-epimerase
VSLQTLPELQAKIAHCNQLSLNELAPGFAQLTISNAQAKARVSLYGAQVLSFQPAGDSELLWLSPTARYHQGRSIRGGIPLCWPWFGPHPDDPSKPSHGFARHLLWTLDAASGDEKHTQLEFSLAPQTSNQSLWPHPFELRLRLSIGRSLQIELITKNTGHTPMEISAALHSYFSISDIDNISIEGLDGCLFRDAVNEDRTCKQCGPIRFHGEVDRVYHDTSAAILIEDTVAKRRTRVRKGGSNSTVVWNPWIDKSAQLGDIPEGGYRHMLCVETANADHNRIALLPNNSHTLYTEITGEALEPSLD